MRLKRAELKAACSSHVGLQAARVLTCTKPVCLQSMQQFEIVTCGVLEALYIVFASTFDGGAGLGGIAHLLQHLQHKSIVADDLLLGGVLVGHQLCVAAQVV